MLLKYCVHLACIYDKPNSVTAVGNLSWCLLVRCAAPAVVVQPNSPVSPVYAFHLTV